LVRTPEFKAWFGDWQKSPKNASKVIDNETKEPMVVYHGTNAEFTIFDTDEDSENRKGGIWNAEYPDGYIFMTSDKKRAKYYGKRIIPLFVNMKYPTIKKVKKGESLVLPFDDEGLAYEGDAIVTDGIDYVIGTQDEFIVKLADGTNTEFNITNPDIRFGDGGETDELNLIKNNTMNTNNPKDTITMDIPLLIRFAELMREDIKTDVALHEVVENLLDIKDKGVLTMSDYDSIVGNVTGAEQKMADGGVLINQSIANNQSINPVVGMVVMLKQADAFDSVYYVYEVSDEAVKIGVNEGNTTGISISDFQNKFRPATQEELNMSESLNETLFAEGGKVKSIHSQKGDIMVSLDDNWYSDDSSVELVPVSELIKFREFDRKVKPKYNQDNSIENINHLKFMFQKEGVKSPLIIEYSAEDNAVLIIEGNHRLNSAIDLGMEYLPARVVLKKYGKYSPAKIKNAMQVDGIKANSSNYIPSDLKPSYIGITGAKPIAYAEGGIIEGRLHSECGDDGCGRKFQVGENGHIIEAERDEAVIVADAFNDNKQMTIEGTPSEIASALNVIGGGKNFDKGAKIIEGSNEKELPEMKQEASNTDVDDVIDSGSIIINRRSMADEKEYKVTGSAKQIASAINSINGNGVVIEKGAKIE
jgi:hypothetical protein